ncbi:hypothetical protein [Burkholderia multivorans]|uniref:hypothetical protein n=1 Tax=Burkholderia multivorans TaxID=87883 RepID=UPI000D01287E|nr:hypothetical protein [Burkholderia multivorans]PRH46150.1 hypothetical protein C6V05_22800 [Burkholderia multivorans]
MADITRISESGRPRGRRRIRPIDEKPLATVISLDAQRKSFQRKTTEDQLRRCVAVLGMVSSAILMAAETLANLE